MRYLRVIFTCILLNALLLSPSFASKKKSNNWAVLICTSKYFFNYRHLSNVLAMYRVIKQSGIPDSQIILMNALDVQCDSRNRYPGHVYDTDQPIPYMRGPLYDMENTAASSRPAVPPSLCDDGLEVDYTVRFLIYLAFITSCIMVLTCSMFPLRVKMSICRLSCHCSQVDTPRTLLFRNV